MIHKEDLPEELRNIAEQKPNDTNLDRIRRLATEIQKNDDILFEMRVLKVLEKHGLIILPEPEEAHHEPK